MKKILILLLLPLMMCAQDFTIVGDVDCSGDVNSEDASLILQFVTNIIDELPCQENMNGLNPEQLQEIINLMDEQLNINYANIGSPGTGTAGNGSIGIRDVENPIGDSGANSGGGYGGCGSRITSA